MFASLKDADQLPVITTVMMSTNEFVRTHLMSLSTGLVVLLFVVATMLSRPTCRLAVLQFLMKIPKLGEFIAVVSLSRFSQLISTLLKNGVMLDKALQLCVKATSNVLLRELVRDAANRVSEGETLSSRFRNVPWIPREFSELLVVGEQTNRLPETLGDVSALYERRVSDIVKSALTLVEPVLLVCIGLTVAAMVFAVVLPILRSSSLV
jgi:type II secretory pathway component PulF